MDLTDSKPERLQGWLQKQGEDFFKSWKKRWFVQNSDDHRWQYFKTESEPKPQGFIDLKKVTSARVTSSDTFEVVTSDRIYSLKCKSSGLIITND